ncbi:MULTISPECIES: TraB/GumN family protein [unclassified Ruegeria]|uniref:TraB/GumN family protein n=1 Tax=unclassified Ruegeria TaxID=2625375 RepID=UPI001488C7C6|nr:MULTISPECIES: TraB/GumN family protein [unclassified Ruegeria]
MRIFLLLLSMLLPVSAYAACEGRDLMQDLSPASKAEFDATLATLPFPEGNHWIATKDQTTLHIIGTLHLNFPQMDAIVDRLAPTLKHADAFYFEVTKDELDAWEKRLAADPSPVLITSGPTLVDLLPEEDWADLSAILAERGIPSWMAAKMRPWFLGMMLALPTCILQTPQPEFGLDTRLTALAKEHGIAQHSLESIDDLMRLFNRYPLEDQAKSLARMTATFQQGEDQITTMANSYFNERHAEVLLFGRLFGRELAGLPEDEFEEEWVKIEQSLLVERNNSWMQRILAIEDQTAVIAVGAAHLGDTYGLLNQLQTAGYTLTRAPF